MHRLQPATPEQQQNYAETDIHKVNIIRYNYFCKNACTILLDCILT